MRNAFGSTQHDDPSKYMDVKSFDMWMATKGLHASDILWQEIYNASIPLEIAGVMVRVMPPALIAAGKSFPYGGKPQRPKDVRDIELLAGYGDVGRARSLLMGGAVSRGS